VDLAVLGVRVEANGVLTATNALDGLTASGARAEAVTNRLAVASARGSVAAQQYAWAQRQGFRPDVLEAYRRTAEGAALSNWRLADASTSLATIGGRVVSMEQAAAPALAAVTVASTQTQRATSQVALSLATMARSGAMGAQGLRGVEMGLMTLLPGLGWGLVAVTAIAAALDLATRASEKTEKAWQDYLASLRVEGPPRTAEEKIRSLTLALTELRENAERRPRGMGTVAYVMAYLRGTASDPMGGVRAATERMAAEVAHQRYLAVLNNRLNELAEAAARRQSPKELADALKDLQQRKLELLALDRDIERAAVAAARTALAEADAARELTQAIGERVDALVRELGARTALLNISDREKAAADWHKAKEGRGAAGGEGMDWRTGLPTVGGVNLGGFAPGRGESWAASLQGGLATVGLQAASTFLGKALDNFIFGAGRAREALRAFTLNMESFRAAMTGNDLAGQIAAVRQSAAALRAENDKATKSNRDHNNTLVEINRLEAVRIAQLEYEATVLAKQEGLTERAATQDLIVRGLVAQGLEAEAEAWRFLFAQQQEFDKAILDGASDAQLATLRQVQLAEAIRHTAEVAIAAARKEAEAAASRLATAQSALEGTRATLEGLRAYSASLRGLTGSPSTNYKAAGAAFEAVAVRARTGDQAAIGQLQGVGEAFSTASRAYNASGVGFQRDVAAVQAVVDEVAATYQVTADAQQQVVDLLTEQNRLAAASLKALEDAEFVRQHEAAVAYYAAAYTAAEAAGDTAAMLGALGELRRLALAQAARATDDLLALQGTVGLALEYTSAQTVLAIQAQATATGAAFDRAAAAIVAGFPRPDVAALFSAAITEMDRLSQAAALVRDALLVATLHSDSLDTQNMMRTVLEQIRDAIAPPGGPYIDQPIFPDDVRADTTAIATNTGATVATLVAGFTEVSAKVASLERTTDAGFRKLGLSLETGGLR